MDTKDNKNIILKAILLAIILIATAFSYSNIFGHDFQSIWGDDLYLLNDRIQEFSLKNSGSYFWSFHAGNYHPLTSLSFAINYKIFGLNPTAFHIQNLIIHLVNIILVFILINKLTHKLEIAVIIALFFGIHPMHVESVTWISGRKDLIYSLFFLISLIYYQKYISGELRRKYYYISLLMFLLSLLAKSMAVTLPLVLLLMDFYVNRKFTKKAFIEKIPFFALSIIFGIIAFKGLYSGEPILIAEQYSLSDRFFLISYGLLSYIVMLFYPIKQFGQSAIHYYPDTNSVFPVEYYIAPVILLVVIVLVLIFKRYRKELLFGFLFFLITISIVTQIIPTGEAIISERYTYIPYLGLFFIIAFIYNQLANKIKYKQIFKPILIIILVAMSIGFAMKTWNRNKVWKDSITLFGNAAKRFPDKGEPLYKKGLARYKINDVRGAVLDFKMAIAKDQQLPEVYFARGLGRYDLTLYKAAIADLNNAIYLDPLHSKAYYYRGINKHKLEMNDEAIADINKAIELNPDYAEAFYYRGILRQEMQELELACRDWQQAEFLGYKVASLMLEEYCEN